jgi:hypothetical protein
MSFIQIKTSKDLRALAVGVVVIGLLTVRHRLLEVGRTARRLIKKQLLTTKMMKT